jgi:predicted DNA-binding WGR domain protein
MQLIKQVSLWFQEGASDKVYEVDLCEVGAGKFVVNFRYGRRGATLKDGTKTTLPVTEAEALKIYNQLVNSKKKEGYQEVSSYGGETTQPIDFQNIAPANEIVTETNNNSISPQYSKLEKHVLDCLKEAIKPQGLGKDMRWSLSRIIWRVGELRLKAAVPTLISAIPQSQALQQYSIAWAMGRCGDTLAIPTLKQLMKAAASKEYVKRIALVSLLELVDGEELLKLQAEILGDIFSAFAKPIAERDAQGFEDAFEKVINGSEAKYKDRQNLLIKDIEKLYLLSKHFDFVREPLINQLKSVPLKGDNYFKTVRHIYKIAELRDDFEILALLSYRIETTKAFFNSKSYYAQVDGNYFNNLAQEMKKPESKLGYSHLTRDYLRKRSWRILRTLGESDMYKDYTDLAVAHLLQFRDSDMSEAKNITNTQWHWNERTRNYDTTTTEKRYKSSANYLSFNKILYGASERFELSKSSKAFTLKADKHEDKDNDTREEAFLKAWDMHPDALLRLLKKSACHVIHKFAIRGVRSNTGFLDTISIADLKEMLLVPYPETLDLCIELAEKRFNSQQPDTALVLAFIESILPKARTLAHRWVNQNPTFYTTKPDFIIALFSSKHEDNLGFLKNYLNQYPLSISDTKTVIEGVLTPFLDSYSVFEENNAQHIAEDTRLCLVIDTFMLAFKTELSTINLEISRVLLQKPYPMLQTLGARIILNHTTPAEQLPDGLIGNLVSSKVKEVREAGVQIFGKLPDQTLYNSEETLKSFCLSPYPEIRTAIRPTIKRLADNKETFGRHWVDTMLPYFRMSEPYEGLHHDIYLLLTESLGKYLGHLTTETALKFLQSSLTPRQLLGQYLLENTIDPQHLTMRQTTKLADHEIAAVREWAQQYYTHNLPRIKYEAAEALRILDAKWDDARQFFFDFFRTHFTEADWTPELLVFICDSTRTDVQQFGKEMITKFFKEENGSTYLMQLSQHPSVNLQNFATHYLEQFATGQPDYIEKLEHYFVTILSQVNRSGVAKARIFHFLEQEGLKNEHIATMIACIMSRQSATMAVADKAACLRVMTTLKRKYPDMEMAMSVIDYKKYEKAA